LKDEIEIILIGAILEFSDSKVDFIPKCLHSAMSIFMTDKSIFEPIPKEVIKSSEDFKKLDEGKPMTGLEKDWLTNKGGENDKEIAFFDKKGVLIYDGIHASAFGRMNYFYRSKGIRLYLLEDKKIMTVAPYSYIDHHGLDKVSDFSENIRLEFWNVCLSKEFKKEWGKEMQENTISFLSYLKIPPSPMQLLEFVKRNSKSAKLDKILDMLEENFSNQKEDMFELKPNIAGFGINLNEVGKRLMKKFGVE